jgi:hypothetical protein
MAEKVVYLPFTIETEEEITDRQAQILANKARWMFVCGDYSERKMKHIAEYNGVKLSNWTLSPAKLKEEIVNG